MIDGPGRLGRNHTMPGVTEAAMSTRMRALVWTTVLAAALTLGTPADAQQWKIYLLGKVEPIVADFYAEETPWIFYHDDQSMYVFAIGCNRVQRIERDGAAIPLPACPVEKLPTTMPRVYVAIMDLEAKRLDDNISRLREQTRAYSQALVGTFAATGDVTAARTEAEVELVRRRARDAVSFLQSQISDTLFDIRLSEQRVGALLDAAQSFPRRERQRYFFAPR